MNWRYFVGACMVVGFALVKAGAPPLAVATGILLATLLNLMKRRKGSHGLKHTASGT
jgi:hypothetical protein